MKEFSDIKMTYVEGLSYWFWAREALAAINCGVAEVFTDEEHYSLKEWLVIIVLIPAAYLIWFNWGAWIRRKYIRKCVSNDHSFIVYNKTNIKYFTLLETLTGNFDET